MNDTQSTTRWRDESVIPSPADYEDIAKLVKLARKARRRLVEFEWVFTLEDLLSLRRAAYEWGSASVGVYKCRSARVLAAINDALGDTHSIYVLDEPKNAKGLDCKVSCARDGDVFRMRGHATFDLVFGYGHGAAADGSGSAHLTPAARETLADSVRMLGWDPRLLWQDARLRPALNAIYGASPDVGPPPPTPPGPATDVNVHFHGPFSALDDGECRCLFTDEIAKRSGIYLWTVNVEGQERPWYVGQTMRSFGQRTAEHLRATLSGEYMPYDAAALSRGELRRADAAVFGMWPQTIPSFLRNYERLVPDLIGQIRLTRFHLAPLDGDAHLHDRVEGAIGRYYKVHPDPVLRNLFGPGQKLPTRIPGDRPLRLALSSESSIAGLPPEIPT